MADNFLTDLSALNSQTKSTIAFNAKQAQVAAEKDASGVITKYRSMTPEEYLASRGGVNTVTGKFGDSYDPKTDLTDAEYLAAIAGKSGTARGAAINAATAKKSGMAVMSGMPGSAEDPTGANYGAGSSFDSTGSLTSTTDSGGPSTNITVLKSLLKGMGFNSSIIDSSSSFLMNLLSEGLDYDNAVSIFLDSKDYTLKSGVKVTSPFYEQYGYLNEGMTNAKSASELYNFVEGSKGIIEKYGLSSKFLSQDSLKKYVKNNVTAKDLDERANAARLKAINADPLYVQSLKMLGYLGSNADLTDFYLDPAIGKEKLESNRSTGAFTTEALRRANAGIKTDREDMMRFEKLTAGLQAKGLTEAEISQTASEGFQNIANTLQPSVGLSNIFEGANAANAQTIQAELESEQFMGTESERRKKLKELGTNIFKQSTGMSTGRTVSYSNYSSAGQI
jgi:hypothetical protein